MQKNPSSVFDNSHASTYRLYQSTAAKYIKPVFIGIYVISMLHT
jgi:hypothetical protein